MSDAPVTRRISGSCHCGNIRFAVDWPVSGPTIPARACGCSMCTKHRAVWTSHPQGRYALEIADEGRVGRYRFGTGTAEFHVCRSCGVVPITTCTIDGTRYAVVNVNCFDGVDRSELVESRTDFEGETVEARLARRQRNWLRPREA